MTEENKKRLLQAYRAAVAAGQDGIADLFEDVILGEMGHEPTKVTYRGGNQPYEPLQVGLTNCADRAGSSSTSAKSAVLEDC